MTELKTIKQLLTWVDTTTVEFQRQMGFWTVKEQINEVFTEVGELNQALRHNESRYKVIEEIWDIVLSALTTAQILMITPTELMQGLREVETKISNRIETEYYRRRLEP